MKLWTKLLLGVGILLFLMMLTLYFLPIFLIKKEISHEAAKIHGLLVADHVKLVRSQQFWLQEALSSIKQNSDALLLMIYEEPHLSSALSFEHPHALWNNLARMASYDPQIGFLQLHHPESGKAALLLPDLATLYPVSLPKNTHQIVLQGKEGYFSLRELPNERTASNACRFYLLKESTEAAEGERPNPLCNPNSVKQNEDLVWAWAVKMELLRRLTPLFIESQLKQQSPPFGIARLDETGCGYALLSEEIFSTKPLFEDRAYYQRALPLSSHAPLASGAALITPPARLPGEAPHAYIGNTLRLNEIFITLGSSLENVTKQLALSSHKVILLSINNTVWLGFNGEGETLAPNKIHEILALTNLEEKSSLLELDERQALFSQIALLEEGNLAFYGMIPLQEEQMIFKTLLGLKERLANHISLLLALISASAMFLCLLFIGRMGWSVIAPITRLAEATKEVVAGKYGSVKLPDVHGRKDEVATLTDAFEKMVQGLQERENVRAVLDKVVSKEVAEEVLKRTLHLGGEDRVVSVLFSDIRGFTHLTAQMTPQNTIQMLNVCMTKISRVIEGEGGVIDKYVGDEVMALYGVPVSHKDHALRAVSSGLLIRETLKTWNEERMRLGEPAIEMGIGIHTGLVVAGNMGAEDRLNYTVLGINVNLAARLCELAGPSQLLISGATLEEEAVAASFYTKPLPPILLKGFSEPIQIYEVLSFRWE